MKTTAVHRASCTASGFCSSASTHAVAASAPVAPAAVAVGWCWCWGTACARPVKARACGGLFGGVGEGVRRRCRGSAAAPVSDMFGRLCLWFDWWVGLVGFMVLVGARAVVKLMVVEHRASCSTGWRVRRRNARVRNDFNKSPEHAHTQYIPGAAHAASAAPRCGSILSIDRSIDRFGRSTGPNDSVDPTQARKAKRNAKDSRKKGIRFYYSFQ